MTRQTKWKKVLLVLLLVCMMTVQYAVPSAYPATYAEETVTQPPSDEPAAPCQVPPTAAPVIVAPAIPAPCQVPPTAALVTEAPATLTPSPAPPTVAPVTEAPATSTPSPAPPTAALVTVAPAIPAPSQAPPTAALVTEAPATLTPSPAPPTVAPVTEAPATPTQAQPSATPEATATPAPKATVLFVDWNGTVFATFEAALGGPVDAPKGIPQREGYRFLCWAIQDAEGNWVPHGPAFMVNSAEVTFYARYNELPPEPLDPRDEESPTPQPPQESEDPQESPEPRESAAPDETVNPADPEESLPPEDNPNPDESPEPGEESSPEPSQDPSLLPEDLLEDELLVLEETPLEDAPASTYRLEDIAARIDVMLAVVMDDGSVHHLPSHTPIERNPTVRLKLTLRYQLRPIADDPLESGSMVYYTFPSALNLDSADGTLSHSDGSLGGSYTLSGNQLVLSPTQGYLFNSGGDTLHLDATLNWSAIGNADTFTLHFPGADSLELTFTDGGASPVTYNLEGLAGLLQVELGISVNGEYYDPYAPIPRNTDVDLDLRLNYCLPIKYGVPTCADTIQYTFPSALPLESASKSIYDDTALAGSYTISHNALTLRLEESYLETHVGHDMEGVLSLAGTLDWSIIGEADTYDLEFPGADAITLAFSDGGPSPATYQLADLADSIKVELAVSVNQQPVDLSKPIDRSANVSLNVKLECSLPAERVPLTHKDKIVYPLPDAVDIRELHGEVKNSEEDRIGSYSIAEKELALQLDQSYLESHVEEAIENQLELKGGFDWDVICEAGSYTLTFPNAKAFPLTFTDGEINVEKRILSCNPSDSNEVVYEIRVSSIRGMGREVVITDVLGQDLRYGGVAGSLPAGVIVEPSGSGQTLTIRIAQLDPGLPCVISYQTIIRDEAYKYGTTPERLTNTATWEEIPGVSKSVSVTVPNPAKNWIRKEGAVADPAIGRINWTVTVNEGYFIDMEDITLTDTLGYYDTHRIVGNVMVRFGSMGDCLLFSPHTDGRGFSYSAWGERPHPDGTGYIFTYQTQVDSYYLTAPGRHTFSNTASFSAWGETYTGPASVTLNNGGEDVFTKSVGNVDQTNYTAEWTLRISPRHVPRSDLDALSLTDALEGNPSDSWILKPTLSVTHGQRPLSEDTDYRVLWNGSGNARPNGFTLYFTDDFIPTEDVLVTYKSRHAGEQVTAFPRVYRNRARLNYYIEGRPQEREKYASWTLDAPPAIELTIVDDRDHETVLEGAKFTLKEANLDGGRFDPVSTKTSCSDGKVEFSGLKYNELYWIEKVTAPPGYAPSADSLYFAIPGSDEAAWEEARDKINAVFPAISYTVGGGPREVAYKPTHVIVRSIAETAGRPELPGATLAVVDCDTNETVEQWISGTTPHEIIGKLIVGKRYILHEMAPADGYYLASSVFFGVSTCESPTQIEIINTPTRARIHRMSAWAYHMPGAKLKVVDSITQETVEQWTSTATYHEIVGKLIPGKDYTVVEVTPPDGYTLASSQDLSFFLAEIKVKDVYLFSLTTEAHISKVADHTRAPLAGAMLKVIDPVTGATVEQWTSTDTPYKIAAKLAAGKEYVLMEETPPNGYALAQPVRFTINTGALIDRVEMVDPPTQAILGRTATPGSPQLSGARLKIMDGNTPVEAWVSASAPHEVVGKLTAGKTYTLVEESPPRGHVAAQPLEFTVSTDGSQDRVELVDGALPATDVSISKRRLTGTDELPGAILSLRMADGTVVDTWVSGTAPHRLVKRLTAGATYTLVENSAPRGYEIAPSITFVVNADGAPQTIIMRDAPKESGLPKTGDAAPLALWLGILGASVALLVLSAALLRRKKGA
ncbi:MAG: SpaA isopeptide-forming pilin-related protein [Candidatus Limiplasma sp.]|nr:SpaA isopeptide-forming pilin-related protein [Candidatus Limiplasma sp.]